MRVQTRIFLTGFLFCVAAAAQIPHLQTVEPPGGKSGDVIVVSGENLDKDRVAKLFLTIGETDTEVEIKEQTAESIRFAIPAGIKPGHYNLTVQTAGEKPTIMVQPILCEVEQ
jgi:IPT/TIG domain